MEASSRFPQAKDAAKLECRGSFGFQQTELNIVRSRIPGGQYLIYIDPLGGIVSGVACGAVAGMTVVARVQQAIER